MSFCTSLRNFIQILPLTLTLTLGLINMRLRNTEHLELSTKMDSKCTHKKDRLHVFWMLRVIYKKKKTEPVVFLKTEPKSNRTCGFYQNRTETEPNLKNPFRTSLLNMCMYFKNLTFALCLCTKHPSILIS